MDRITNPVVTKSDSPGFLIFSLQQAVCSKEALEKEHLFYH
jgi:hypothetical protein